MWTAQSNQTLTSEALPNYVQDCDQQVVTVMSSTMNLQSSNCPLRAKLSLREPQCCTATGLQQKHHSSFVCTQLALYSYPRHEESRIRAGSAVQLPLHGDAFQDHVNMLTWVSQTAAKPHPSVYAARFCASYVHEHEAEGDQGACMYTCPSGCTTLMYHKVQAEFVELV